MKYPALGFGLGLRSGHFQTILNSDPAVDWFEIITENFLVPGGRPHDYLSRIAERYPIVMHGVSLSVGSSDPLDFSYLQKVKALAERYQVKWVSDHLCWTGVSGVNLHDLMPLPFTEAVVNHIVDRVKQVQDFLGRRILLENLSSYVTYQQSEMTEWEFVSEIAQRADCLLLLDINNIYVSACNHNFLPQDYIDAIPIDRVQQFHLAGHSQGEYCLIDTHDNAICQPVFDLYRHALERFGPISTMIERDDNIPPLAELLDELAVLREIAQSVNSQTPVAQEVVGGRA